DVQPRLELLRRRRYGGRDRGLREQLRRDGRVDDAEADDEPAGIAHELAACHSAFVRLHAFTAWLFAARWIAEKIRVWLPHRQIRLSQARRTSASEAFGFVSSSAFA